MGKKKKLSTGAIALIVAAVILAILIIVSAAFMLYVGTMDRIYPNVYIAGTNVRGMTTEEAAEALTQHLVLVGYHLVAHGDGVEGYLYVLVELDIDVGTKAYFVLKGVFFVVEIDFLDNDDLDRIIKMLGVSVD